MRLGSLNPEVTEPTEFETALGDKILLEPLLRTRERVHLADGFSPCVVLLNNDLSAGIPEILKGISKPYCLHCTAAGRLAVKPNISARTTKLLPTLPS